MDRFGSKHMYLLMLSSSFREGFSFDFALKWPEGWPIPANWWCFSFSIASGASFYFLLDSMWPSPFVCFRCFITSWLLNQQLSMINLVDQHCFSFRGGQHSFSKKYRITLPGGYLNIKPRTCDKFWVWIWWVFTWGFTWRVVVFFLHPKSQCTRPWTRNTFFLEGWDAEIHRDLSTHYE